MSSRYFLSNLPWINDCNSSSQVTCCPRLALFGALSAASCMQIRLFSENPVHLVLQLVKLRCYQVILDKAMVMSHDLMANMFLLTCLHFLFI